MKIYPLGISTKIMFLGPGILFGLSIPMIFLLFTREKISGTVAELIFLEAIFLILTVVSFVGAFSTRLIVSESGIEEHCFVFRTKAKWLELRAIEPGVFGMVWLRYEQKGRAKTIFVSFYIDDWQNSPLLESIKQNASGIFIEESLPQRINIPLFARSGIMIVGLLLEFVLYLPFVFLLRDLLTDFTELVGLARFSGPIFANSLVGFMSAAFSNGTLLFSFGDLAARFPKVVKQRAILIYANPYISWILCILLLFAGYGLTSHFFPRQLGLIDLILKLATIFVGGGLPHYLNKRLLEHQLKRISEPSNQEV